MKFLPLLWAGIWRRRGRTILTFLSIINAFLLLGLLNSFTSGLGNISAETRADSLITHSKISMFEPLPRALVEQIRSVPGVRSVTPLIVFPTSYQNQVQGPIGFGVKAAEYFAANPDLQISQEALAAMEHSRTGAIISSGLATRYQWKVGDRVPLVSALWTNEEGSNVWPIDIVGIYKARNNGLGDNVLVLNYDYVDEGRISAKGTVNWFNLRVTDHTQAAAVSARVDDLFANSSHETKTVTTSQLAQDQVAQIGNISFVVNTIAGAVLFALLFYVGMVMIQSGRERTPEFATLKALGFTDRSLLVLVASEALVVCVIAALLGLLLASAIFPLATKVIGIPIEARGVTLKGLLLAVGLALLSGLPPAILAMRLSVVEALARK